MFSLAWGQNTLHIKGFKKVVIDKTVYHLCDLKVLTMSKFLNVFFAIYTEFKIDLIFCALF